MKLLKFLMVVFLISGNAYSIFAQKFAMAGVKPYAIGEKLKYHVNYSLYIGVDVAEIMLKVDKEVINDKIHHKFVVHGVIYNYYESLMSGEFGYQSVIDPATFLPKLYLRYINLNKKEDKRIVMMSHAKKTAITKDTKQKSKINGDTQDMLSMLYYIRSLDFTKIQPGTTITVNTMVSNSTYNIGLIFKGRENVKTKFGTISCLKFHPKLSQDLINGFNKFSFSKDDKLIKSNEQIIIYLTDDANKIPVLISTVTYLGKVNVELYQFEGINLANSLLK